MARGASVEQPDMYYQRRLLEIRSAKPSEVVVHGRRRMIRWMRAYAEMRLTSIMLEEPKGESYWMQKRNVRAVSVILLNDMWKIRFFHWIHWRWLFYVQQVTAVEVLEVLEASKKKMTTEPCMMCTTSLIGMMDTMMAMTREEARLTQAERPGEQPTP